MLGNMQNQMMGGGMMQPPPMMNMNAMPQMPQQHMGQANGMNMFASPTMVQHTQNLDGSQQLDTVQSGSFQGAGQQPGSHTTGTFKRSTTIRQQTFPNMQ